MFAKFPRRKIQISTAVDTFAILSNREGANFDQNFHQPSQSTTYKPRDADGRTTTHRLEASASTGTRRPPGVSRPRLPPGSLPPPPPCQTLPPPGPPVFPRLISETARTPGLL
ncbi:Hypothetical protein NTJ_06185 [Nesidiocoris tenuis]|uniref:Uncharacterized protein n=1 Tax=Nesidiocoris tenuis TaxID=355587 RepID=A0ABN7AR39_9HEMI|nr:Hypothetical protein NTJ_06185 [Nesidiocoris tenuis]